MHTTRSKKYELTSDSNNKPNENLDRIFQYVRIFQNERHKFDLNFKKFDLCDTSSVFIVVNSTVNNDLTDKRIVYNMTF